MSNQPNTSHVYVGPTTKWGLSSGTLCSIHPNPNMNRGGLLTIIDVHRKMWRVPKNQVRKR